MQTYLETGRLRLRQFTAADEDHLLELNSDPDVMRYINGGQPTPRAEIREVLLPFHARYYARFAGFGTWAAEDRPTGEFLGWFHFRSTDDGADLGYRLRRAAWNQGYATEGARALIRTGFTGLGVQRVFAHAMAANAASRRVLEKCGLVLVPAAGSAPGPGGAGAGVTDGPGAGRGGVRADPGAVGPGRAGPARSRSPDLTAAQASTRQHRVSAVNRRSLWTERDSAGDDSG